MNTKIRGVLGRAKPTENNKQFFANKLSWVERTVHDRECHGGRHDQRRDGHEGSLYSIDRKVQNTRQAHELTIVDRVFGGTLSVTATLFSVTELSSAARIASKVSYPSALHSSCAHPKQRASSYRRGRLLVIGQFISRDVLR